MNHLAHFALAGDNDALIVGSFLGDYVKGRLGGQMPQPIEKGVRLHRAIDHFTDTHPIPRESAKRLPEKFYRYGGIITDIVYDHLLAIRWRDYYDVPLAEFSRDTLEILVQHSTHLPGPALETARRMQALNSLAGYGEPVFVERSLSYLSTRLKRTNPLAEATPAVKDQLSEFEGDLGRFFPELMEFCDEWIKSH